MVNWIWTCYCSLPDDPKGQYSEEIDVMATHRTKAKSLAEAVLKLEYDPGLKIRKIVRSAPVIEGKAVFF